MKRFKWNRVVDPRGLHVTYRIPFGDGSFLLGEVKGQRYDTKEMARRLIVRHFNGEPWPIEPFCWEVEVLERDYPQDS